MSSTLHRRRRLVFPLAAASAVALTLAGCTGDIAAEDAADVDCSDFEQYGDFSEESPEVTVGGTIVEQEADNLVASWADFQTCTGITISYQGSQEFEAQIPVQAEGGNAPDVGIIPQPGLLARLASGGYLKPVPASVEENIDSGWTEDWKKYGTVDDTVYAAPLMASIKGYIWYSPAEFEEKGYEIPKTMGELTELSETIAAEGDHKPWCVGFGSGEATGWPGTDWIEDYVLRMHGTEVYDQWTTHQIPFNDPRIVEAFDAVGEVLKNPDMVNGGFGAVDSIVGTTFNDGGKPILEGECSLHHQATFYEAQWPEGTEVAEDGDVYAFLLPPMNEGDQQAVTGAGEFVAAFTEGEEIDAFRTYLSSPEWANTRTSLGGNISANNGVDPANGQSPILQQSIEILQDPNTVFRFDGSDLMPGAVGAGSFWKGIVGWVSGDSTQQTVDAVESSWPQ
ncbi:ABC transporter substrate-binding protein [Microbacteriaceae bacterium 4G12]